MEDCMRASDSCGSILQCNLDARTFASMPQDEAEQSLAFPKETSRSRNDKVESKRKQENAPLPL
eukprot:2582834-Amphidinium_carterae.1